MANLDPALQTSISELQSRHTALVDAVRNYSGGSVAQATNDLVAAKDDVLATVDTRETSLLGLIQRNTTKPVPSLLLDFKNQVYMQGTRRLEHGYNLYDLLTVERATPKWVYSSSGKLVEVPPNKLAYHYDPVTGVPQGTLIEESRTNLLLWSEDFTQEYWGKTDGFVVPGTVTAPDGESLAYKFVGEAGESIKRIGLFTTLESETAYTQSWYVKSAGVRYCSTYFRSSEFGNVNYANTFVIDLETGEFNAGSGITPGVVRLPDGWFRISITGTTINNPSASYSVVSLADSLSLTNAPSITGDGTSGIYIWGAQLEEGSSPSSYIPTTDAPVTRAADNVYRTLGDEFNREQGTFLVRSRASGDDAYSSVLSVGETSSNRLLIAYSWSQSNIRFVRYASAGNTNSLLTELDGMIAPGDEYCAAISYDVVSAKWIIAANGITTSDTINASSLSEIVPTAYIGALDNGSSYRSPGPTAHVEYYPRALTEQELIELTS